MNFHLIELLKVSTLLWIFLYGLLHVTVQLLQDTMPCAIIAVLSFVLLIHFFRIKPPSPEAVEAVLGKDPLFVFDDEDGMVTHENVMRVVGHRGARYDCPENTLESFKLCADKGVMAIELDLMLTADDVCVIFHDDSLERMTGDPRDLANLTYSELQKLDLSLKHPHGDRYGPTRIPTLRDAIDQCLKHKQKMFFDIKDDSQKMINTILEEYQRIPDLHKHSVCSTFYPSIIYKLRKAKPEIVGCLAWRPYIYSFDNYTTALQNRGTPKSSFWFQQVFNYLKDSIINWAFYKVLYYLLGLSCILLHKDSINGEEMYNWRCKGVRVIAWTVNHPVEKMQFSRVYRITYLTDTLIGESKAHKIPPRSTVGLPTVISNESKDSPKTNKQCNATCTQLTKN